MLTDLTIKNFAIIDSLHISFGNGLNILTGETGAGKSIIIDAVNLILGGRASVDLIRSGAEEAAVEALFALDPGSELEQLLAESGFEAADELLLKRIISRSGKNRVFINGSLATLSLLTEIASRLVNIYGQHESQTLLRVENHLRLLDSYAALEGLKREFAGTYQTVKGITEKIAQIEKAARDAERERDILLYKLDELGKAALIPGEDEELERERILLSHAGKLLEKTGTAYDLLYGGGNSALGTMGAVRGQLRDAAAIDHSLAPLCEAVDTAVLQLEDAALTLRDYAARIESDPLRLQSVDDRLELIRRMKKKYGATIEEVLACRVRLEEEFTALSDLEGSRALLEEEAERLRNLLKQQGESLSAGRRDAAAQLHVALEKEVHQLALKHAVFTVVVEPLSEPRETGYDRVEFLFSPNPGEDAKPLAKIASGGELSRIMLAMKQIHPESDVPTLIFDEVDTGIGGATSALVGQKLKTVASRQQVLCITHMPQVAVFADNHYRVAKNIVDGRTVTTVAHLGNEERVDEIARMLGGVSVTAKTLEHAREMIETVLTP